MSRTVKDLRARIFASTPRDRDAYHAEIEKHLARGMTVLDVGCGKGHLNPFPWNRHPDVRVVGIDPDPEAGVNDLAVCRYVVEHVEDPDQFTGDVRRVLRPGGRFIFLTPSRYHPVILASSMPAPRPPPGDPVSHQAERRQRRIPDVLSDELEARPARLRAAPRLLGGTTRAARLPAIGLFRLQPRSLRPAPGCLSCRAAPAARSADRRVTSGCLREELSIT